jgi:hypothetical protein
MVLMSVVPYTSEAEVGGLPESSSSRPALETPQEDPVPKREK